MPNPLPDPLVNNADKVASNGVDVGTFDSSSESASAYYSTFVLHGDDVETLTLTASGLDTYQWISLLEVRYAN